MLQRERLVKWLRDCEEKFETHTWRTQGIDIWPVIKMVLAFEWESKRAKHQPKESILSISFINRLFYKIKREVRFRNFFLPKSTSEEYLNRIKKVDYLFASFPVYREAFDGKFKNKFFDPFMDYLESNDKKTMICEFEYGSVDNFYKPNRVFNVDRLMSEYSKGTANSIDLNGLVGYNELISEFSKLTSSNYIDLHSKIESTVKNIQKWVNVSKAVIEKSKPKKVFLSSYYSIPMFGLILACKENNIPTIEIQHGGLDDWHYCYTFQNPGFFGLNTLPDYFWLWSELSQNVIRKWTPIMQLNKVFNGGNPWIEYLSRENADLKLNDRKIALYTLQPGVHPLIPNFIMDSIREDFNCIFWILRFHPRMSMFEKDMVRKLLTVEIKEHKIGLDNFQDIPLPLLIKETYIHISAFSGCLIEAHMMDVPFNITFHENGKNAYSDLIDNGEMHYYDEKLEENFLSFVSNCPVKEVPNEHKSENLDEYFETILGFVDASK